MSDYYTVSGNPASNSLSSSSSMRSEFSSIATGFGKLPSFSGNASKIVQVNSGETALEATATPTVTSINKVAITTPASSATLTIANGKTFTCSNTLTLTGTDSTSLNINAVTNLNAGVYTPTLTAGSNITSLTAADTRYFRIGNYVFVSGLLQIQVDASVSVATFDISLPISSNIGGPSDLSGTAVMDHDLSNVPHVTGLISGDSTDDRAYVAIDLDATEIYTPTVARYLSFDFSYTIA